ncbi:sulfatase [Rhizobium puerariae]|uniref:Sulfatase n=1 Tax=Rhizobium puerariae TaxID=1585791 RepID=A0ABV6AVU8_9HYPH
MNEPGPSRKENAVGTAHARHRETAARPVLRAAISLAIAAAILALPSNPAAFADFSAVRFPLEVIGLALLACLSAGAGFALLRWTATLFLAAMLFLKLADIGTGMAFQRPFNPYLDAKILTDGWNLLSGAVGAGEAAGIICAGLFAWLLVVVMFYRSLGGFRHLPTEMRRKSALAASILLIGLGAFVIQDRDRRNLGIEATAGPYFVHRVAMVKDSIADLTRFESELEQDPVPAGPHFQALAGTDVVLIFIESYGRSAIEDPRYTGRITGRLALVERDIAAAGLEARSGWLTSPTVGGISWLAHGTLLSGLRIDSQARYDRMIASRRRSLNSLFHAAGWRTTVVMPAITMDWPEAGYFGYDSVHDAHGLGYRGKPFNWVTMPDQYTLSAFERLERRGGGGSEGRPVMAEMALISSHAPWTPVPSLIDWDKVGDGTAFDIQAGSGDPPSVVWTEPERVRAQYAASIDYVLETLGSYMARYGRNTLFILLGDHQPASIITGEGASRDVPVHIVTGNPELMRRLDRWNWRGGMVPLADTPVYRMDEFRRKFVESFD